MIYLTIILGVLLTIPQLVLASDSSDSGYYEDRERGWFWYEKIEDIPKNDEEISKKESGSSNGGTKAQQILKKQGKDWEEAIAEAVVNPTKENVVRYLDATQKINAQAMNFSDAFKRAIWVNPEFDYTLNDHPVTTQAIAAKNQQDMADSDEKLRDLADKQGILFFFRSDCPHCHRFAPILKKFSDEYGFTVVPVSLDGGGVPAYPYPKKDYALGKKLKVSAVPAVFLLDPETNSVATVGYGYSGWTALKQKILVSSEHINKEVNNAL